MSTRFLSALAMVGALGLAACGGSEPAEDPRAAAPAETPPASSIDPADPALSEVPASALDTPAGPRTTAVSPAPAAANGGEEAGSGGGQAAVAAQPSPPVATPAAASNDAREILARAEAVYEGIRSMEADFVQEVYVPLLDNTQHSRGRIFHRRPDRFLMRFSDPEGDIIVADGRHVWMYYPSVDTRQVMRGPLGAGGQQVDFHREFLSDATRRYAASRGAAEPVGGRTADVLTLTPRAASAYRQVRIWVDRGDHLVRRFEIVEENGTIRKLELSNLRTNVTLSDDLFRFDPPPGTQIFEP